MSQYCLLLRKDLRQPLPPAHWPQGFTLVTLTEELLQPVHALISLSHTDGTGSMQTLQDWQYGLQHDPEYDPALCFVILLEGQAVAVAQAWTSAYLKDLAVHPHHRGRG